MFALSLDQESMLGLNACSGALLLICKTYFDRNISISYCAAVMKAITNKDAQRRALKKCFCLRRSLKLRRFRSVRGRFHRARSTFKRVCNTIFLTGNLRSFRQFFCLKEEIQEMKKDLKFLEAQMKEIDGKLNREGRKPSEDVKIWPEEAEKIKKAVDELNTNFAKQQNGRVHGCRSFWHGEKMISQVDDDKSQMEKQNGYVGICPVIWHRFKMSLKVDEYKLRVQQLQNRHTKFEGNYGGDRIEHPSRKAPALKAFEMSEETICSINNWASFRNNDESSGDNSDLVHPLEKTPLFCLAFILQFFTGSETTVTGLIIICWVFVLTLFYVLSHQNKISREPHISPTELECSSTCHSGNEISQTAGSNCTTCSEMMEQEVGCSSSFQRKLDGKPQQEIVPIED